MKRNILLVALCCFSLALFAKDRSAKQMIRIAQKQLATISGNTTGTVSEPTTLLETSAYSVLGADNAGFVVVAKDAASSPIVAYSSTDFGSAELPPALAWWMEAQAAAPTSSSNAQADFVSTKPFVTTSWGQSDPYNYLCPKISGVTAPTGCVATALAQIMNYYEYPESGTGTGRYSTNGGNSYVKETVSYTYDWANLSDWYPDLVQNR